MIVCGTTTGEKIQSTLDHITLRPRLHCRVESDPVVASIAILLGFLDNNGHNGVENKV